MIPSRQSISNPDTAAARAEAIAPTLAALGARYDAAPVFPVDSMTALTTAGLHLTFAPIESGGDTFDDAAARNQCLMTILRIIGRADLSVGRLYEGHVNALALFDWYGSAAQKADLGHRLTQGAYYGLWATEPQPGVQLSDCDGRLALHGAKSFATGAGGLTYAIVTARPAQGERQLVVVRADDPARTDLSQWRVRGMRATGSGLYDLTDVTVDPNHLLGMPGDYDLEPRFTTGAWRFTAVQLGGIEALLAETRLAMSDIARADPLQRAKFADAVAATRTAYLWVRECALRAAIEDEDGPAFARMTRGIVERAGLDVMELAARITGTRSAMDGQRIDKIIRDLSLYLRQGGPDYARDQAALAWLDHDAWGAEDALW
jgi:alkylation response protein AidB-like acyl-CoA dehydrogenase